LIEHCYRGERWPIVEGHINSTEGEDRMTRFIDASQPLHDGTPAIPPLPPVEISWLLQMSAGAPLDVSLLTTATHAGTHVDAPSHAIPGGRTIDQIPPERFIRPCLVVKVEVSGDEEISADALRSATDGTLEVGDALIISTGWGELFGTDAYREHPAIGVDAAEWMVEVGVDMVGVDLITVDAPVSRRPAGFDFPVHRTLLGNDVLIIENLISLHQHHVGRARLHALPLPLAGRDAAQARVLIEG
jgi:kynurenine formamidase